LPISQNLRVNEQIRVREVRLIDEHGNQVGVVPTTEALQSANEAGLDLVEVAPTARPPVCRILDFGKYKYEQKKKAQVSKKKQHIVQVKELRMKPKTEEHDRMVKVKHARKFIEQGDKVLISMNFRGREMAHIDIGRSILEDVAKQLTDIAKVEKGPVMDGRRMLIMFARK
jgi:translation initiation factor IF-3